MYHSTLDLRVIKKDPHPEMLKQVGVEKAKLEKMLLYFSGGLS